MYSLPRILSTPFRSRTRSKKAGRPHSRTPPPTTVRTTMTAIWESRSCAGRELSQKGGQGSRQQTLHGKQATLASPLRKLRCPWGAWHDFCPMRR